FQAEDGIRDPLVTGVQTCALPISFTLCGSTFGASLRIASRLYCETVTTARHWPSVQSNHFAVGLTKMSCAWSVTPSGRSSKRDRSEERRVGEGGRWEDRSGARRER